MPVPASDPARPPQTAAFDPKSVHALDWAVMAAGVLAFLLSFFSYYTASVSFASFSTSVSANAWHGFFGWFAMLCAVAGSALVALAVVAPRITLPVPHRLAAVVAYGVAALCVLLALFVVPGGRVNAPGAETGHGFGYWASLIVIVAATAACVVRLRAVEGQRAAR